MTTNERSVSEVIAEALLDENNPESMRVLLRKALMNGLPQTAEGLLRHIRILCLMLDDMDRTMRQKDIDRTASELKLMSSFTANLSEAVIKSMQGGFTVKIEFELARKTRPTPPESPFGFSKDVDPAMFKDLMASLDDILKGIEENDNAEDDETTKPNRPYRDE